ncbi:MAG: hypothetical protein ISS36_00915 [Candidatus Aenigmarchaeota archaeon]|nr:hypothetical protein [Candidatus Aenigmarchaeota archaeon]
MAEILEQKKNPLLKREESWILIEHKGKPTPKRDEILSEISKVLKSKDELIIIDKVFSQKGKSASRVKVLAYSKKEDIPESKLEKMKRRALPLGKRGKSKEGEASGDAPSEAPTKATEKPSKKEPPKEEPPKEDEKK